MLQFGVMALVFAVVFVLWLRIIYLPARTMEHWEGEKPGPHKEALPAVTAPEGQPERNADQL